MEAAIPEDAEGRSDDPFPDLGLVGWRYARHRPASIMANIASSWYPSLCEERKRDCLTRRMDIL